MKYYWGSYEDGVGINLVYRDRATTIPEEEEYKINIYYVDDNDNSYVLYGWGKDAQKLAELIKNKRLELLQEELEKIQRQIEKDKQTQPKITILGEEYYK